MRVLVTGATGFIGAFVTRELLRDGCEVHAFVEHGQPLGRIDDLGARITVHRGSLLDAAAVTHAASQAKPEVCLHLAWYAVPGKYLHAEENVALVGASVDLARAVAAAGCRRFVGAGTCIEYDTSRGLLSEDRTPIAPRTLYGVCKNALHGMLAELGPRLGLEVAWLRFFFLYGPTEAPGRLVSEVLGKLLRGEEAPVTPGEQVRDFMHVADIARAVATVLRSKAVGPINIGSGEPVTVRQVVAAMGEATGRPELVRYGALPSRPGDPPFICADATRLRGLGFVPAFDLRSGLADTVRALRAAGAAS